MARRVDIANLALSLIGANQVTAFEDDSEEARLVSLHYDYARDATLEAQEWSFAMYRFMPDEDVVEPLFGWARQFVVPTDVLRVVSCDRIDGPQSQVRGENLYQPDQIDWQVEDRRILTEEEVVYAIGIRRITDEGKFSPLFVHAFAAKLAMLIAIPLTQSNTIFQQMAVLYESFLAEAKSRDGIQGRSRRIRQKSFQRAR